MARSTNLTEFRDEITGYEREGILTSEQASYMVGATSDWWHTGEEHRDPDTFWKLREKLRIGYGIYTEMQWKTTEFADVWDNIDEHLYAHVPMKSDDPRMVAYTKNAEGGEKDVQVITRIGKFLAKHTDIDDEVFINHMANEYRSVREEHLAHPDTGLFILTDPYDIYRAYRECSTHSCMSYDVDRWALHPRTNEHLPEETRAQIKEVTSKMGGLLHPVCLYGFTPELGVAIQRIRGKVVSRTTVNIETKKWLRIFGNNHLRALLKEDGWTKGSIGPVSVPLIKTTSHKVEHGILAPYVDACEERPARGAINMAANLFAIDHKQGNLGLNHYSTGCIPAGPEHVCRKCNMVNHGAIRASMNGYCSLCVRTAKMEELKDYRVGVWIQDGELHYITDHKDRFVEHNINPHMFPTTPYDLGDVRNIALTHECRQRIHDIQNYGEPPIWDRWIEDARRLIHVDRQNHVITDDVRGDQMLDIWTKSFMKPDTTEGRTAGILIEAPGNVMLSFDWFENGQYGDYGDGLVRLSSKVLPRMYNHYKLVRKSDCVEAHLNRLGATALAPREYCVFSLRTGKWFARRSFRSSFKYEKSTEQGMKYGLQKYGKEIMQAGMLVDLVYPATFDEMTKNLTYRSSDKSRANYLKQFIKDDGTSPWTEWHEELHLSRKMTTLAWFIDEHIIQTGESVNEQQQEEA